MRTFIAAVLLGSAIHAGAQPILPATTQRDLHLLMAKAKSTRDPRLLANSTRGIHPVAYMNGEAMVGFLGKVAAGAELLDEPYIAWGARIGDIVSFRVDAQHLDRLMHLTFLTYAELARPMRRMLDRAVRDMHADSVQQGINLPQSFTGRNTILGIADLGFDYTHPMFYDTAMTATRILAAWDQNKQSGPHPVGYGYGAAYEGAAELLAAQCDTTDGWGIRDYHGTHVAGIAGGGGAGTPYRGVAFDADFLFVSFGSDDAFGLDAYAWMHARALQEGKRLVVNASWGIRDGPLDGTSLLSQAMEQYTAQGVLFVCANGNYGDVDSHIKRTFAGDTVRTRAAFATTPWEGYEGQSLLLWGESGMPFSASIAILNTASTALAASPWYATAAGPAFVDSMLVSGNDTLFFQAAYEAAHPLNGKPMIQFRTRRTSTLVKLGLHITAPAGVVHAWNDESFIGGGALGGTAFQAPLPGWTAGDRQSTVIDPACAPSVIGVGAYFAENNGQGGALVGFSSRGPTMDQRMKPDICAPGAAVVSSISAFTDQSYTTTTTVAFNGNSYPFGPLSGTSMATPMASGCAALLLEAAPTATPAQIKAALMDNARTDSFTGFIPPQGSTAWGRGKVNVYRAVVELIGVAGVSDAADRRVIVYPNPADEEVFVVLGKAAADARYELRDLSGRIALQDRIASSAWRIALHGLAGGAYMLVIMNGTERITRRIVKQ